MSPDTLRQPERIPFSRGLSLVELMVAALLGIVLIMGMASLYLSARQQFFYDEQLARLQENGRFAIELLRRELRMAGFYGGLLAVDGIYAPLIHGDCSAYPWALDTSMPVTFTDDHPGTGKVHTSHGVELDCLQGEEVAESTDILAIRRTAAAASVDDDILAPGLTRFSTARWYLNLSVEQQSRWQKMDWDDLRHVVASKAGTRLWRAVTRIFYVRKYSDPENHDDGIPVLCREELVNEDMRTRCLVEGVENMQFEVGVDTDGDLIANRYLSPGEMAGPLRAVSARVYLLVRSVLPVPGINDQRTYRIGRSTMKMPGDAYLRRVFSTTVELRNLTRRPIAVSAEEFDEAV